MESASSGMLAGINCARALTGREELVLPRTSMMGALSAYVAAPNVNFQPMGANFGILPPLETPIRDKRERYAALAARGLADLEKVIDKP